MVQTYDLCIYLEKYQITIIEGHKCFGVFIVRSFQFTLLHTTAVSAGLGRVAKIHVKKVE